MLDTTCPSRTTGGETPWPLLKPMNRHRTAGFGRTIVVLVDEQAGLVFSA
jgi:hypothetical protein